MDVDEKLEELIQQKIDEKTGEEGDKNDEN